MSYVIISGSQRKNSQSLKVSKYIKKCIEESTYNSDAEIIDLGEQNIPYWDENFKKKNENWTKIWSPISEKLAKADGFIVVSPEWNGMVPPVLKNFLLLVNQFEVGHKPALIVTVSAGKGGSYPINELRTSGYKNTKICYIPEHIIVRNVNDILNSFNEPENEDDVFYAKKIKHSLAVLYIYTRALKQIRTEEILFKKEYTYGM